MKNLYVIALAGAMSALSAYAQEDYVTPVTIDYFYAQKVSPNGNYVVGQDNSETRVISYEVKTGKLTEYEAYYPGNGNYVANNGFMVGQDIQGGAGALLYGGKGVVPTAFDGTGVSSLNGITPDARRACGYMTGRGTEQMIVPCYIDIDANGNVGKPVVLPFPAKDFFGTMSQMVIAEWISDDGKTIVGMVTDSSGFYTWPIVFREDSNGVWTYSLPTERFFNPEGLPLPQDPENIVWGENGAPAQPKFWDYMTQEEYKEFYDAWTADNSVQPWDYMTAEEYRDYEKAISEFNREANKYLDRIYDEYHRQLANMGRYEQFMGMTLSPDGKILTIDQGHTGEESSSDVMIGYTQYVFNLDDDSFNQINLNGEFLIPTQILPDGTTMAVSSKNDFVPYRAYIRLPEMEEYMLMTDFLEQKRPAYFPWIEDTLGEYGITGYDENGEAIYGSYIVTGVVSCSRDMSVIAGGLPIGDMMSYIYEGEALVDGVDLVVADELPGDDSYYNLQGVRIANPGPGIYIRNGKKVIIR